MKETQHTESCRSVSCGNHAFVLNTLLKQKSQQAIIRSLFSCLAPDRLIVSAIYSYYYIIFSISQSFQHSAIVERLRDCHIAQTILKEYAEVQFAITDKKQISRVHSK
jgi:hypothetical protein